MASTISPLQRLVPGVVERVQSGGLANPVQGGQKVESGKFGDLISDMIHSVNDLQQESAHTQQAFLAGEPVELHQMMIKAEEAGVAMDLVLEVRNRLVNAYNDLIKMPM